MSASDPVPADEILAGDLARMGEPTAEAGPLAPAVRAADPIAPIRRYALLERIGAGGMGVIFTAYDGRLDRKVALKVLKREESAAARARFRREAQALARLHHPNVVAVFDAGEVGERPYLVMELVDGASMRTWLGEAERSWREIVRVMIQAGRGLAAAHAAGLIHRDVKLDNILVARDGSARMADFGLARLATSSETDPDGEAATVPATALDQNITQDGLVPGTPGYLAPEKHVDARSDQYSFAVTLERALAGVKAPIFLTRLIARGKSDDPYQRFPDMDALLDELGHDPARTRRRALLTAGIVTVAMLVAVLVWRVRAPSQVCAGGERALAGVWDDTVKATMRRAFTANGRGYAGDTADRITALLDARASDWVTMRREACEATALRHEQSTELLDLRMTCLDRRLGQLGALAALFGRADAALVDDAVPAVYKLDGLQACADQEALRATVPLPADPAQRAKVAALRQRIDEIRILNEVNHRDEALAQAKQAVADARALAFAPLVGETLSLLGSTQASSRDDQQAQATLEEALGILSAARDDRDVARTWISLMAVMSQGLSRPADALALRPAAEAAVARAGGDLQLRVRLARVIASALRLHGDLDQALVVYRQTLALPIDPADPVIADLHNGAGIVLKQQGKLDEALAEYQEAQALAARAIGADNVRNAGYLMNVGNVLSKQGRFREALTAIERARAVFEAALGPDSVDVAVALNSIGETHLELGELAEARAAYARDLAICEKKLTPEHLNTASALLGLANVALLEGRTADALTAADRALASFEHKLGPKATQVVDGLITKGKALTVAGRLDEAGQVIARALAIVAPDDKAATQPTAATQPAAATQPTAATQQVGLLLAARATLELAALKPAAALADAARVVAIDEGIAGADNPSVAVDLVLEGEALLDLGRRDEAAVAGTRAIAILTTHEGDPLDLARARFGLARALPAARRTEAHALAEQARAAFAAAGPAGATDLVPVDAWLR